ncbi:Endoplasmic reticulum calcium ATPase isoform 1 [Hibiscus syriacus]|uniref:Endoplasmic reticulum calcium ATPase isoform 1 n=1 Tax=Hibiscus syriacus TaxID=106335 RepID=A0A6A2ZWM8_HIBSY|nr:protein MIZU-KUSSEI 1-like [Hibiscus syriacus]KAE8696006.1 Endoplasmic reticulum calcium ATPase isoform 1 [Hibiscus syriacus]
MSCPTILATATHITNGVTSVDCQKQVRSWRLLRSLTELLIPTCNRAFVEPEEIKHKSFQTSYPKPVYNTFSSVITGTIFGYRRGRLSFCIQANSKSTNPILLLEFTVPTLVLAQEMQGGILRIAMDCTGLASCSSSDSVLSMPLWTMYCNGRKVGYAVKRRPSKADVDALRLMSSVVVGAGRMNGKQLDNDDELMYLRANFERVRGSSDTESFHLIDPDDNMGHELSIFFFRSR